jgi:hypothetical protein
MMVLKAATNIILVVDHFHSGTYNMMNIIAKNKGVSAL